MGINLLATGGYANQWFSVIFVHQFMVIPTTSCGENRCQARSEHVFECVIHQHFSHHCIVGQRESRVY
jgi:hypothetical protein